MFRVAAQEEMTAVLIRANAVEESSEYIKRHSERATVTALRGRRRKRDQSDSQGAGNVTYQQGED